MPASVQRSDREILNKSFFSFICVGPKLCSLVLFLVVEDGIVMTEL